VEEVTHLIAGDRAGVAFRVALGANVGHFVSHGNKPVPH